METLKSTIRTSPKGRRFVEEHEGLRQRAYMPVAGEPYWSAGYGHMGPDVKPGVTYSIPQCRSWLRTDLHTVEGAVAEALAGCQNVKQQEIDALVSGGYNMGSGYVIDQSYSTLARRLRTAEAKSFAGRCRIYADEFPKWVNGMGGELPGLVERRKDELRLAKRGRYGLGS